ncbi:MAG: hypothetical protein KatS3mg110_4619 [Pirellulaceae bacterium]|nr:MAG: hypothetical protein KatS3mg110_4619 [Pirellulaceae bacterium]
MTRLTVWILVVMAIGWLRADVRLSAQDPIVAELYGRGVHAYYRGDLDEAYRLLDRAINKGTSDPRVYYFRGCTLYALGRKSEAEADFRKGAELEVEDVDNTNVSRALERVQGQVRLVLEKHREQAQVEAAERRDKIARALYAEFLDNERRVLFPPKDLVRQPVIPPSVQQGQPSEDDPFAGTSAAPMTAATAPAPTPPAPPASPTPSASQPPATVPAPTPAQPPTGDPFAAPGAQPKNAANDKAGGEPQSGKSRGAVSGLFRAFGRALTPSVPEGLVPGLPGGELPDPFGEGPKDQGGTDPFAPQRPANPPQNPPKPGDDPFAPPKN